MQVGDIITIQGMQVSDLSDTPLLKVSHAKDGQTVVGVVQGYAESVIKDKNEPDGAKHLVLRDGAAKAGDYVTIVMHGMMEVNVSTSLGDIKSGDRLTVGVDGLARALQTRTIEGMQVSESSPTLGIALEDASKDGKIWVFVNPQ
ncbi:MAG: hypothetical protein B6242_04295 [Anaerolineaceae bacterium 4572_78]|nr:MAG: hypothetical protein B6242_04295 [Anaerolineaceae bacterium 4572_78]